MNRLEREVLEEIEDDSYEFNEERAKAIVALCREALESEIKEELEESIRQKIKEETVTINVKDYGNMYQPKLPHIGSQFPSQHVGYKAGEQKSSEWYKDKNKPTI